MRTRTLAAVSAAVVGVLGLVAPQSASADSATCSKRVIVPEDGSTQFQGCAGLAYFIDDAVPPAQLGLTRPLPHARHPPVPGPAVSPGLQRRHAPHHQHGPGAVAARRAGHTHPATWDFIGQQVFFANRDGDRDPDTCNGDDSWDNYRAQRGRIMAGWVDRGTPNPVVLTGNVHRHWAVDLLANPYVPTSDHIGVELVATSISSGGRRADPQNPEPDLPANMPYIKYLRDRRGYLRCTATQDQLTADFMELSDPLEPDVGKVTISPGRRFTVPKGLKRLEG